MKKSAGAPIMEIRIICERHGDKRPHVVTFGRREILAPDYRTVVGVVWEPVFPTTRAPADYERRWLVGDRVFSHAPLGDEARSAIKVRCRECNAPKRSADWRDERLGPLLEKARAGGVTEIGLDYLDGVYQRYAKGL